MSKTSQTAAKEADEFASAMQQLSAEAEKTVASTHSENGEHDNASLAGTGREFASLNERMASLEQMFVTRLDQLVALKPLQSADALSQMQKIDEHMVALRNTESVNQRLFDSLHQELKDYRDNFLRESLQKPFIRDLIVLFDDLSGLSAQMQLAGASPEARKGPVGQWCDNLENAIHSLLEVMHRMEVNEIEPKDMVDRAFHRVVTYEPADFVEDDGRIVMRVRRGFLWRDQVLRPEEVVAKRFN